MQDGLHEVWSNSFEIYTDSLLKNAGSAGVISGAAAYFPALNISVGVRVHSLVFFIMTKLQAVALSLKWVLSFCFVVLHLNSQAAIDLCE
ncbi:hypothetical protein G9A89_009892 [Geosiphon pyriformis]|nr:hypothetical protein G9A89_009892 [Geosiphon pyriformis]